MVANPARTSNVAWRVMLGLALMVAAYALVALVVPGVRAPFLRERVQIVPLAVFAHLGASAMAIAVGPFQLNARLRSRHLTAHRWTGRLYACSVLAGGISALVLATVSQGGAMAHAGFGALAVVWIATLIRGWQRIRAGDDVAHRRWMIRNYALTFAAVTLRMYLPLALVSGVHFDAAYGAIAWLCWVPNLIFVEYRYVRPHAVAAPATVGGSSA